MTDVVNLIEEGEERVAALVDDYLLGRNGDAESAEALLALVLLEIHLQTTIEQEILMPAVEAIAAEFGSPAARRMSENLEILQRDIAEFCACRLRGSASESSMRELLRSALRHIEEQRRYSLPEVRRWLDAELREELGSLLRSRRSALETEIQRALE